MLSSIQGEIGVGKPSAVSFLIPPSKPYWHSRKDVIASVRRWKSEWRKEETRRIEIRIENLIDPKI